MNEFKKSLKVEIGNMQDIPAEDNIEEDIKKYLEHKEKRNERVFKKFGKDYKGQKREKEQKELLSDLEMEFNERNRGGYGR